MSRYLVSTFSIFLIRSENLNSCFITDNKTANPPIMDQISEPVAVPQIVNFAIAVEVAIAIISSNQKLNLSKMIKRKSLL